MARLFCVLLIVVYVSGVQASDTQPSYKSVYAGQEAREIKSLSAKDIAILKRGGGWGFARAAELNGMPGPVHVLELKQKLGLGNTQISKITEIYEDMRVNAVEQGKVFIALERELEVLFRNNTVTEERLEQALNKIAQVRAALRYIHLAAHLKVAGILRPEQVRHYNILRGYTGKKSGDKDVRGSHHGH
ncbi:MAG: hypothetical protein ACRBBN_06965 [Methyloligellaceae bacterium]